MKIVEIMELIYLFFAMSCFVLPKNEWNLSNEFWLQQRILSAHIPSAIIPSFSLKVETKTHILQGLVMVMVSSFDDSIFNRIEVVQALVTTFLSNNRAVIFVSVKW